MVTSWGGCRKGGRSLFRFCDIRKSGDFHRWTIWKLRHQIETATHSFNIFSQRGEHHVTPLFKTRYPVLRNLQFFSPRPFVSIPALCGFPAKPYIHQPIPENASLIRFCRSLGRLSITSSIVRAMVLCSFLTFEPIVKPCIRFFNQLLIKALLASSGFISGHQKHSLAFRVKDERHTPDPVIRIKTSLFHIRMPGACQRIRIGTAKLRTKCLQRSLMA